MVTNQEHAALVERVGRLEKWLGEPGTSTHGSVFQRLQSTMETLDVVEKTVGEWPSLIDARIGSCDEELNNLAQAVDIKLEGILDDLRMMKRALRGMDERPAPKVKVPEPKPFEGARSSKELENFLWDMENYFKASHIPENEKVSITSMYLAGDAKLWWRSRVSGDATAGRDGIETWEALRKELKDQFLPCNASWLARRALRELKHTGSVHEYVREFSSLLLDVKDMSEEDKLFNFLAGLQTWAQAELNRQGVKDLQSAIAAADGLIDFRVVGRVESEDSSMTKDSGKKAKGGWKGRNPRSDHAGGSESDEPSHEGAEKQKKRGCYHCNGDHLKRNCPKLKGKLNAIVAKSTDGEESVTPRMGSLQLVNALVVEDDEKTGDDAGEAESVEDDLQRELSEGMGRVYAYQQAMEARWCDAGESDVGGGPKTTRASSNLGPAGLLDP